MKSWFGVTEVNQVTDSMKAEVKAYIAAHPTFVGNEVISADCDSVVSKDSEQTTIGTINIPQGLREDYPLRSAGTAYDYLLFKQENGTLKVEHHGKTNLIDLGTLNWSTISTTSIFEARRRHISPTPKEVPFNTVPTDIVGEYEPVKYNGPTALDNMSNKQFAVTDGGWFEFKNTEFTDAAAFKAAMSGVYLIYEKDTETVTDVTSYFPADTITYLPVEDGGSLTFHQTGTEFAIPNEEDFYYKLEAST